MNNPKTNIYDIDGKLIRGTEDTHEWTIEEAQERIKYYIELLKALNKEDKDYALKAATYNKYIDNLVSYTIRKKLYEVKFTKEEPKIDAQLPPAQIEGPMNDEQIDIVDLEPVDGTESVDSTK
jgi:hypothetical protein